MWYWKNHPERVEEISDSYTPKIRPYNIRQFCRAWFLNSQPPRTDSECPWRIFLQESSLQAETHSILVNLFGGAGPLYKQPHTHTHTHTDTHTRTHIHHVAMSMIWWQYVICGVMNIKLYKMRGVILLIIIVIIIYWKLNHCSKLQQFLVRQHNVFLSYETKFWNTAWRKWIPAFYYQFYSKYMHT